MSREMSVFAVGLMTLASSGCHQITTSPNDCVQVQGPFVPAAPGFIVLYKSGADPVATTSRLEAKYAFSASHVYTALPGFAAQLSDAALAGVRCESVVAAVSHDGVGTITAH